MNVFKVRKIIGLFITGILPLASFFVCYMLEMGVIYSIGFAVMFAMLLAIIMHFFIISHPFIKMIESNDLIAFEFSSRGIIQPFLVKLEKNKLSNKKWGIVGLFDRATTFRLNTPKTIYAETVTKTTDGVTEETYMFKMPKKDLQQNSWGFDGRAALVYNSQIEAFMDKETMGKNEMILFSQHQIMMLNKKVEELSSYLRDWQRYIVEISTKPKSPFWQQGWFLFLIIGIVVIVCIALGLPILQQAFDSISGSGATKIIPVQAITPK